MEGNNANRAVCTEKSFTRSYSSLFMIVQVRMPWYGKFPFQDLPYHTLSTFVSRYNLSKMNRYSKNYIESFLN